MLLSLADIFRCPADHEETSLVLSVDAWRGQRVERGVLGCPHCRSRYPIASGAIDFRSVRDIPIPLVTDSSANDEVDRVQALLNLADPGGVILLAGRYAALGTSLARLIAGRCRRSSAPGPSRAGANHPRSRAPPRRRGPATGRSAPGSHRREVDLGRGPGGCAGYSFEAARTLLNGREVRRPRACVVGARQCHATDRFRYASGRFSRRYAGLGLPELGTGRLNCLIDNKIGASRARSGGRRPGMVTRDPRSVDDGHDLCQNGFGYRKAGAIGP
jgi:uncharacterized protein YbaR (Trm112 family)